jgi:hypothetical protein
MIQSPCLRRSRMPRSPGDGALRRIGGLPEGEVSGVRQLRDSCRLKSREVGRRHHFRRIRQREPTAGHCRVQIIEGLFSLFLVFDQSRRGSITKFVVAKCGLLFFPFPKSAFSQFRRCGLAVPAWRIWAVCDFGNFYVLHSMRLTLSGLSLSQNRNTAERREGLRAYLGQRYPDQA